MEKKDIITPLSKVKDDFLKWLNENKASYIQIFKGELSFDWEYYTAISAVIGDKLYFVKFMMWKGEVTIDYDIDYDLNSKKDISCSNLTISEFVELIA